MRSIAKRPAPEFFLKASAKAKTWKRLADKPALRQHISTEQQGLCVYCEAKLDTENSHIEHLAPQEYYPQLRFVYENLAVSCDGYDAQCDKYKQSCGHRKNNEYEPELFLNPNTEKGLEQHFCYDKQTGEIQAVADNDKANYMIDILWLNNKHLQLARLNARRALLKVFGQQPERLKQSLGQSQAFISFLRACFLGE